VASTRGEIGGQWKILTRKGKGVKHEGALESVGFSLQKGTELGPPRRLPRWQGETMAEILRRKNLRGGIAFVSTAEQ